MVLYCSFKWTNTRSGLTRVRLGSFYRRCVIWHRGVYQIRLSLTTLAKKLSTKLSNLLAINSWKFKVNSGQNKSQTMRYETTTCSVTFAMSTYLSICKHDLVIEAKMRNVENKKQSPRVLTKCPSVIWHQCVSCPCFLSPTCYEL